MAKGISINFLADVRDFLKGTKNVEDQLDDVADSLDVVAKEGEQSTEKLEDGFRELAKAAKKSGDDIGDGMKKGFKEASEGADALSENTKSNAKEVAASFDGSIESIADGFQGLAAEAFEGFGPAGLAAGALVAAGIGLATAEIQRNEEAAKLAKERTIELGQAFIESGAGVAGLESFNEQLKLIISNADDAPKKLEEIQKLAKDFPDLADDISTMAVAFAGNEDATKAMIKQLEEAAKAERAYADNVAEGDTYHESRAQTLEKEKAKLEQVQKATEDAAKIEQEWLASGGAESQAKADAIGVINAAYDEAVYAVDNFKNAETGIYDLDAYAQSIRDREQLLKEYQSSLAESGLTTEQKAALNEMGVEQANAILKGLKDPAVSDETKKTIKNGLKTASQEGSGVAKKEIEDAFKKPVDATVKVKADTSSAQSDLDNLIKARTAVIRVDFQDRFGKRVY